MNHLQIIEGDVLEKLPDIPDESVDLIIADPPYNLGNNMRGANPGDVWQFSHVHYCNENRQNHPTQKPEGLIERMVLASSAEGDVVLGLFSGSGTTLRVCQQVNRNCIGIELNPEYVKMIEERLNSEFTGFDSIDPRMERVPLDLNTKKIREKYLENHKKWFLNRQFSYDNFEKSVQKLYGKTQDQKREMQEELDFES